MLVKLKPKILIILGPTASGKTKIAVKLAQKFNGEIVGADSRQVYKGMDIGTGKDLDEFKIKNLKLKIKKIPYHLIDVVSPNTDFNVGKYKKLAYKAIDDILERGKLPIIVGGTGLYVSAVVDGLSLPKPVISKQEFEIIRKKLEKLSLKQLLARLKKTDPKTYKIIDKKNRRRVQRALEIYYETGKLKSEQPKGKSKYDCLQIGIGYVGASLAGAQKEYSQVTPLQRRIEKRLEQRLKGGAMIKEVKRLHEKQRVSWKRLESFGLEYKWISWYLRGVETRLIVSLQNEPNHKLTFHEMKNGLAQDIKKYAKRQMTWLKRDERIVWENSFYKIVKYIKKHLNQK